MFLVCHSSAHTHPPLAPPTADPTPNPRDDGCGKRPSSDSDRSRTTAKGPVGWGGVGRGGAGGRRGEEREGEKDDWGRRERRGEKGGGRRRRGGVIGSFICLQYTMQSKFSSLPTVSQAAIVLCTH